MTRSFKCERCHKAKDLEQRGKHNPGRAGICISCLKKMGVFKIIRAGAIPKKKMTLRSLRKRKNPMVRGYLTPVEES